MIAPVGDLAGSRLGAAWVIFSVPGTGIPPVTYSDLDGLRDAVATVGDSIPGAPSARQMRPLLTLRESATWDEATVAALATGLLPIMGQIPFDPVDDPFDRPAADALMDLLSAAARAGQSVAVEVGDGRRGAAEGVARLLLAHRYQVRPGEKVLHGLIAKILSDHGCPAVREVEIGPSERVDLVVTSQGCRVAVEVKRAGSRRDVQRQLSRYAACPDVDAIVLATTVNGHRSIPRTINGKPVVVAWLTGVIG
jgi:hypothetical protein